MHLLYPKVYFQKFDGQIEPATSFVLMPFRDELLPVFDAIRDALEKLSPSVKAVRADDIARGGAIIADILAGIARADFIIADLTGRNANVFYEVGICHAMKDDVILLTQEVEDLPFDLRHLRCVVYESSSSGLHSLSSRLRVAVRDLLGNREMKNQSLALKQLAYLGATRVGEWISSWVSILDSVSGWPELRSNDAGDHQKVLGRAAAVFREFKGGIYTLDAEGTIIGSFPLNIRGQRYAHREYFRLASRRRTGVVSNSFDSNDREHSIIVIAVPRFDHNGVFLGILDAVMDVDDSPLNGLLSSIELTGASLSKVQLLLVDQRYVVVGANQSSISGKNVGGNSLIRSLFDVKLSERSSYYVQEQPTAAVFLVHNTPFRLIALYSDQVW
jgi:hypothetical protein